MRSVRLFLALVRWDVIREFRRKEVISNMILFALLVLFVAQIGIGSDRERTSTVGPVIFWISILFAGTVGLSQTFAAEREGNAIAAVATAPVDAGIFYLAKVAASWLYVMVMATVVLAIYSVLFEFSPWGRLGMLAGVMGVFTLAYIACGVVLAAMTTSLHGGGEVVLRILLIPLMLPLIWLTLRVSERVFGALIAGGVLGPPLKLGHYLAAALAFDTIYLTVGYILFPKVLEE
jgi:heme exporter protein B